MIEIFDIQHFCVHDGPGIRTTVFLKGCPLHCLWCHNPEALKRGQQMMFYRDKCINCGMCGQICQNGAHTFSKGIHMYHRNRCNLCGKCVTTCAQRALEITGYFIEAPEMMEQIKRDRAFYTHNGGVTFSGGEPLMQYQELRTVIRLCREEGIHTAIETSLYTNENVIEMIDQDVDLVICDYKMSDSMHHKKYTGVGNERILKNMKTLLKNRAAKMWVRTPIIPGINDTKENMRQMAEFLSPYPVARVELLPFHDIGLSKYHALGETYSFENTKYVLDEKLEELKQELKSGGVSNII